uniref:non-specific lipid-transfer protein-like n=1 Tax=Styela clava TaxID=7725 RepID=UPI001939D29A|nr:non-specific lipid-transfer protein-like [Styela clava]
MTAREISASRSHQLVIQQVSSFEEAKDFKSTALFEEMKKQVEKDGKQYVKKVNGIIGFRVTGPGGKQVLWIVDAKNGNGSLELNSSKKPDCTITMKDDDLVDLMLGKLNPNTAFFGGKLKIAGNMGLAMKIQTIMPAKAKL